MTLKEHGIVAIDIGSSSIRVSLFTKNDGIKDMWKISHSLHARFAADSLWIQIKQLIQKAVKAYPGVRVNAMAVSSFLGWVVIDEKGEPVEPAWGWKAYAEDNYVDMVLNCLPDNTAVTIGRKPSKDLTAFLWGNTLKKYPAATVLSYKDYCIYKLTGVLKMDRTHASYTGLLSISERRWDADMIKYFDIPAHSLPELGDGEDVAGGVMEKMAAELGVSAGIPVALSGPDGTMAVLGSGGVAPGKTVEVLGTTDVFFHINHYVEKRELYDEGLVQNCFLDSELYGIGGPMGMTGGTVDWFMKEWELDYDNEAFQDIWRDWRKIRTIEDGLYIIPTFTGARVPDWNSSVRGTVVGLKPEHSRVELYKAAVEGVAFLTARLRKKMKNLIDIGEEMIAIGGGAKNKILLQTRASASNCYIYIPEETEASTIGAILLAAKNAGFYSSLEVGMRQLNPIKEKVVPDQNEVQKYKRPLQKYSDLISHMDQWYDKQR
ncbi:xylulokinase [Salibacterium aidingense]|uniref:xylulokinase n=1 Tax=Salibacterium aidingense TaxID=384933 RepID=UPI00047904B0|nr:FGGY-family carbohydrate kinase [Salibacterium aidingense]